MGRRERQPIGGGVVRRITFTAYNGCGEPVVIPAFTTAAPGLVVHESMGDPGWMISHERSGLLLCCLADPESAQAAAAEFGPLADWTMSGTEIKAANAEVAQLVSKLRSKWEQDIWGHNDHPIIADRLSA